MPRWWATSAIESDRVESKAGNRRRLDLGDFLEHHPMEEEVTEGKLFATFEKLDEFQSLQQTLLDVNLNDEADRDQDIKEWNIFRKLCDIVSPTPSIRYLTHPQRSKSSMNIKNNLISWIPSSNNLSPPSSTTSNHTQSPPSRTPVLYHPAE